MTDLVIAGIVAVLAASLVFQLGFNVLFATIAIRRRIARDASNSRTLRSDRSLETCLFIVPVLNEDHLLSRCLRALTTPVGERATIAVALDGKDLESIGRCETVIQETLRLASALETGSCLRQSHLEEELIDALLSAESDAAANVIEERWRKLVPIQRIPTTQTLSQKVGRRKGEAINLILSLCGKRCLWLRFPSREVLAVGDTVAELRGRYNAIVAREGIPIGRSMFSNPKAAILVCVDVDEVVSPESLVKLRELALDQPQAAIIQCVKRDLPISDSLAAHAFHANYSAWFHWEAAWPVKNEETLSWHCCYYGSMAAIRLNDDLLLPRRVSLAGDQQVEGSTLFPEGYAIEDYPFFAHRLIQKQTLLADLSAATGDAPSDLGAVLSLWARWTRENVKVFIWHTLPLLARAPTNGWKTCALLYHGMSWFAHANTALITSLLCLTFLTAPSRRVTLIADLALVVMLFEVCRRLITTPGVRLSARALRIPVEYLLFPVAFWFTLAGAIAPWKDIGTFPSATPRDTRHHYPPAWVLTIYGLHASLVVSALASVRMANNPSPALLWALIIWSAWSILAITTLCVDIVRGLLTRPANRV